MAGDLLIGPSWANRLVLAGLVLTVVFAWRIASATPSPDPGWWWINTSVPRRRVYLLPQGLVAAGFVLSVSTGALWLVAAAVLVGAVTDRAVALVRRTVRHSGVRGASVAVVLCTAALVQLGAFLLVRLVLEPDPAATFDEGVQVDAWRDGSRALLLPLAVVAVVIAVCWRRSRPRSTDAAPRTPWVGTPQQVDDAWMGSPVRIAVLGLATLLLFMAPLAEGVGDSAALTFGPIATPEYAKILFVVFLAIVVTRYSDEYYDRSKSKGLTWRGPADTRLYLQDRAYALWPIGMFLIAAAVSGARRDFGTLIPLLAATATATWTVTRRNAEVPPNDRPSLVKVLWRRVRVVSAYRTFIRTGAMMLLVGGLIAILWTNVGERAAVWSDPWAYNWRAPCVVADPQPVDIPGISFCRRTRADELAETRSQESRALAAIADGGLWGRGLHDKASRAVSVGSSDYVLAVVWNKLGGLVVVAILGLVLTLGATLRMAVPARRARLDDEPSAASLVATGVAAMIVGQFLYVLAATINLVPESGVPAPFIARGGQATIALLLGIALVLVLAQRAQPPVRSKPAAAPRRARVPRTGILLPAVLSVAAIAWITLVPYQSMLPPHWYAADRPPCGVKVDAARCSTDAIAAGRTRVAITLNHGPGLVPDLENGGWKLDGAPGGLVLGDLTGIVATPGAGIGLVENSYPDVLNGTVGTTLDDRVGPVPRNAAVDGGLDLTIDPHLQHVLATAMSSPGPQDIGPLVGGMVVLNASTGHILAAVSAPLEIPATGPTFDRAAADAFIRHHADYQGAPDCAGDGVDEATGQTCWKWDYIETDPGDVPAANQRADLARYVGGDMTVAPGPIGVSHNRAVSQSYGLGSTFKVVIAAAFFRLGHSPDELIEAPYEVPVGNLIYHNFDNGQCPGVQNGQMTVRHALAVSCNTAFIRLAQRIGWGQVAETAALLRMNTGTCNQTDRPHDPVWLAEAIAGARDTCVPQDIDDAAIGNDALGGLDVSGTPLSMASLMATIANHGVSVPPTIVDSMKTPGTGRTVTVTPAPARRISAVVADRVIDALSETAVDGTAARMNTDLGMTLWVKTGTLDLVHDNDPTPKGVFRRDLSWMVGFVRTPSGPIAFAVVMETKDEPAGGQRVRYLVEQLCEQLK